MICAFFRLHLVLIEERNNYIVGEDNLKIIKSYLSKQKNLGKTLELGCGDGIYSDILRHEAKHLTATDFSDEMVTVAKRRFKDIKNVNIEKADCFNLPYSNSSFNTVFMANLLHVISEPEKAVAECKRVLKKNGKLIVISLTTEGMTFFNKLGMMYRYLKTYGKPPSTAQTLTVKKTRKILEGYRFEIEEAKLIGNNVKAIFVKVINSKYYK